MKAPIPTPKELSDRLNETLEVAYEVHRERLLKRLESAVCNGDNVVTLDFDFRRHWSLHSEVRRLLKAELEAVGYEVVSDSSASGFYLKIVIADWGDSGK